MGFRFKFRYVWFDMGWIAVCKALSRDGLARATYASRKVYSHCFGFFHQQLPRFSLTLILMSLLIDIIQSLAPLTFMSDSKAQSIKAVTTPHAYSLSRANHSCFALFD
jgi:hypothetical protein